MNCAIIYNRDDYEINSRYAKWLSDELKLLGIRPHILLCDCMGLKIPSQLALPPQRLSFINRSRNYNLSLKIHQAGYHVFNNPAVALYGNNKIAGYEFAKNLGLPVVPQISANSKIDPSAKVIRKPNFGHGGKGITVSSYRQMLLDHGEKMLTDEYIYQPYIEIFGDLRFYIMNGEIIHSVLRYGGECLQNYSQGAKFRLFKPNAYMTGMVNKITQNLHIDYAGVDFYLLKNNELIFGEIEDAVGSRMLSELSVNDTASLLAKNIFTIMSKNMD